MGEVEIAVEVGGGPDSSGLDAPVIGRVVDHTVGLFSLFEEQG